MNDIINIKEKFKVDDSHSKIRGFVCAYDEEGRLVFSKENMIVESGRRFILNNGIKEDSLKYVFLSENGTPASPADTLAGMGKIVTTDYTREKYDASTFNSIEITHDNFEGLSISSESILTKNLESGINNLSDLPLMEYLTGTVVILKNKKYRFNGNDIVDIEGNSFYDQEISEEDLPTSSLKAGIQIKINNIIYTAAQGESFKDSEGNTISSEDIEEYLEQFISSESIFTNSIVPMFSKEAFQIIGVEPSFLKIDNVAYFYEGENFISDNETVFSLDEIDENKVLASNNATYYFDINSGAINKFSSLISEKNYFSYIIDQEQLVIKCLICFNDKSSIAAKSLGIVVNNGTEEVLFSRVTFPTYYKSNHQRLTFKYYIYF